MADDWKQLTLSDVCRLITVLAQNGINFEAVRTIIAQVPPPGIPHSRITMGSIERLLNQTNGSTYIPEELALLINQPEEQPLVVQPGQLTIDCNAHPKVPDMWQLGKHSMSLGQWVWNQQKIMLNDLELVDAEFTEHAAIEQYCFSYGYVPANADILDFLLEHPNLIPSEWKGKLVYFCGTTYESDDVKMVRCLAWGGYHGWHEVLKSSEEYDDDWMDNDDELEDGNFIALVFP